MEENPTLFGDLDAGRAARDEGMERVSRGTPAWRALAYDALVTVAVRSPILSSENVLEQLDANGVPEPHDLRALGPVMMKGVKNDIIRKTGQVTQATRKSRHAGDVKIYRSLVYTRTT